VTAIRITPAVIALSPGSVTLGAVAAAVAYVLRSGDQKSLLNQRVAVLRLHRGVGAAPVHVISARHLTETTARPRAPHPWHRTRSLRGTLARGSSPSFSKAPCVSSAT
jgi:hypothetical protein